MTELETRDARDDADVIEGTVVGAPDTRTAGLELVKQAVTHPRARAAARHAAYVGLGGVVVARRLWDARSTGRYDRFIRACEASGDREGALEWEERRARFLRERHSRRMDWIELPGKILVKVPWIAGGTAGFLGVIGISLAVARHDIGDIAWPFEFAAAIVAGLVFVVGVTWGWLLSAAGVIAVLALWRAGKTAAEGLTNSWIAAPSADDEGAGMVITADAIVVALQHLGRIPELKRAFKDGWMPVFDLPPVRDDKGYSAVFRLPLGVTADMIADQRPVLARNLQRAEVEVWPTDGEKARKGPAGSVALWVADRGVIDQGAPEYPLLCEGTADVFQGVPGGVSPRGQELHVPIVQNNFVAGGQMGNGKSNACRVVMLGAALDPLAELWVHVMAYNGDFDAFGPRLARYVKGAEDPQLAAAVATLQELYEEVERREKRLAELGAKRVTRGLAEKYPDLRPRLALFSECHELFRHPDFGRQAAELAVNGMRRSRKAGIWYGFDTQSSRKDAIPPALVELVSVNVCFYVKNWRSNDGFLGDGSFHAGIRATELRPGRDIGRSVVTGITDEQYELLMWHFVKVDNDTGWDAAAEVIERAMGLLHPGTPARGSAPPKPVEHRSLLDDLDEVMGLERVKLRDLTGMLRSLAPHWLPYERMTAKQLGEELADRRVRVINSSGTPYLDPGDLADAVARFSTGDLDDDDAPWN